MNRTPVLLTIIVLLGAALAGGIYYKQNEAERSTREAATAEMKANVVDLGSSHYYKKLDRELAKDILSQTTPHGIGPGSWVQRLGKPDALVLASGGGRCVVYLPDPNDAAVLRPQALLDLPFDTREQRTAATPLVLAYVEKLTYGDFEGEIPHVTADQVKKVATVK